MQREKVFNLPGVVLALVVVFLAIHAVRVYGLTIDDDGWVFRTFAYVAGRMTFTFDPDAVATALTDLASDTDGSQLAVARYLLGDGSLQPWTLVTYGFLHADWMHVGMNCLWLVAFGAPVAQRLGPARFLALFLVGTALGALTYYVLHPVQFIPLVGASAGVSAAMGAACRFIFQPGGALGPADTFTIQAEDAVRVPAVRLADSWKNLRILQFIAIWFAINLVVGLLAVPFGITETGIAWEAHIGGFITGFFFFSLFDPWFYPQGERAP
ncbi:MULTISPECIES: rhomboid family intramembrane serine protease [unclassified Beijerinckia]|uniref:rhomboid family intramembrane serine protease n=1 Tax=unclassified Beijerinckia TaxID=2638183 RepID=UPI000B854703|nr:MULTISPECIES: rhomboid family intramembrane serine protease [unclassified Beijerinckia]